MSNKSLNKKINKYLNKQRDLREEDKITLKDGFNLMRMKIHELREYFDLDSLRGIKVYLLDSENIGRTESPVWSAERVIQAYNDFERDNFFRDTNSPVRIPIIFLYKENRVDKFLKAWNPEGYKKKNKKIKRFIIPLDGSFASNLKRRSKHFSPDDMQIIHYAEMLKKYQNHFKIGEDCKLCIKGVRIVSKDKFRDHKVGSSIKLVSHTVRKNREVIIPRTKTPAPKARGRSSVEHKSNGRRELGAWERWHLKETGKLPDPNTWVTRLSPAKKTRKRGRREMIISSPSGLTPGKKRGTRKRGGKYPKRTIKKRKSGRKHRRTKRRRRR